MITTLGPWFDNGCSEVLENVDGGMEVVAHVNEPHDGPKARLIAAAPELLNSCKKLLAHAEWMGVPKGYSWDEIKGPIEEAAAVIKKVERL